MTNLIKTPSYILICLVLSSCYISKKLPTNIPVYLNVEFIAEINNSGSSSFSSIYTQNQYKKEFLKGLDYELSTNGLLSVDIGGVYNVFLSNFSINESTKYESVSDVDSPDDADTHELTSLSLDASGKILSADGKASETWYANKSKSESITNNRSTTDYALGSNKDGKSYREKPFSEDICIDLTYKCGRRSGVRIIKIISKMK